MKQYLLKLIDGATLTQEETHSIMLNIIDGSCSTLLTVSTTTSR